MKFIESDDGKFVNLTYICTLYVLNESLYATMVNGKDVLIRRSRSYEMMHHILGLMEKNESPKTLL